MRGNLLLTALIFLIYFAVQVPNSYCKSALFLRRKIVSIIDVHAPWKHVQKNKKKKSIVNKYPCHVSDMSKTVSWQLDGFHFISTTISKAFNEFSLSSRLKFHTLFYILIYLIMGLANVSPWMTNMWKQENFQSMVERLRWYPGASYRPNALSL